MRKFLSLRGAAAGILLVAGLVVMLGWIVHSEAMVRLYPGFTGMVFNAGLGFGLLGAALLLPLSAVRHRLRWQSLIGWCLSALGAAVLLETGAGLELPIDFSSWQSWLGDGNLRPGRMAPGVSLGLLLCGSALVAMRRVRSKRRCLAIVGASFTVFLLGLIGLAGFWLRLDLLYAWYPMARMAPQSAAALIVAGVALWASWRRADWYRGRLYLREDERTGYIGAAILSVIALCAGVTGFGVQQAALEKAYGQSLQAELRSQAMRFQSALEQGSAHAHGVAQRAHLAALLSRIGERAPAPEELRQLGLIAKAVLASGVSAVAIHDGRERELLRLGRFGPAGAAEIELGLPRPGSLFWDQGFHLRSRVRVGNGYPGDAVGSLVIEQALPQATQQLAEFDGPGSTMRMDVCMRRTDGLLCFPQGQNQAMHAMARFGRRGQAEPMGRAVDGSSGIFNGLDARSAQVLAAYGPLTGTGLGMVIKQDAAELYEPIREQFQVYALFLILLMAAGALLLRTQVTPVLSKLLHSEREATERRAQIHAVVDHVGEGIITFDEQGWIKSFNRAAARIFGYGAQEAIGRNISILTPPDMRRANRAAMHGFLDRTDGYLIGKRDLQLCGLHRDGTQFPLEVTISQIRVGGRRLFIGIARDVSEREKAVRQVQRLAHFDILTDLPNRTLLRDRLRQALAAAKRAQNAPLALLFIDLDKFKQVNDALGHHCGDLLLKDVARRLQACLRDSDTVARIGGDEFVVLLPTIEGEHDALVVAQKILDALGQPFELEGRAARIWASIGIATYPRHGADQEQLVRSADRAMYDAKQNGGGAVVSSGAA